MGVQLRLRVKWNINFGKADALNMNQLNNNKGKPA